MTQALDITAATVDPALLDLPWHLPLEDWPEENIAALPKGLSRHTVRFAHLSGHVIAIKETLPDLARREYEMLKELQKLDIPCVEPFANIRNRRDKDGNELPAALITRHLKFSLPYRAMWSQGLRAETATRLVDALAVLLVRLHLEGFFWGDVSLSNTLFRRDAGAFAAYLVDAETGQLHESGLSAGQRENDLEIARINIAGELMDLVASGRAGEGVDPNATSERIVNKYHDLWKELTAAEVFDKDERWRINQRVEKLDAFRVKIDPEGDEEVLAHRWLSEVFEPVVKAIPREYSRRLEPAEVFHQVLLHRWELAEKLDRKVPMEEAVNSYVVNVLAHRRDEEALIAPVTEAITLPTAIPSGTIEVDEDEEGDWRDKV
jgi:hypothetical protein